MSPSVKRHWMLCGNLLVLGLSVTLGIVAIELCSKAIFKRIPNDRPGKQWVRYATGEIRDEIPLIIPHPYMLYTNAPSWYDQTNSQGYRGSELQRPAVLCLGGSTTYGSGVASPDETWPSILGKELGVEVVNGGKLAATSADLLSQYLYRDRFLGCQVVILHVGVNDVVCLWKDSYDPELAKIRAHARLAVSTPRPGEARLLSHSATARVLYAKWMAGDDSGGFKPANSFGAFFQDPTNPPPQRALQNVRSRDSVAFRRNIEALIRNIQAEGATTVIAQEPIPPMDSVRRLDPTWGCYSEALEAGMEKHNAILGELAAKYKVQVVPVEMPESFFCDWVHVTVDGEKEKARIIAEALRRAPLGQTLSRIASRL